MSHTYYQRNKEKVKAQVKKWQEKNSTALDARREEKRRIVSLLKSFGCVDCRWSVIPEILEFHHIDVGSVSYQSPSSLVSNRAVSIDRLIDELSKGVFLCPTCHVIRHYDPVAKRIDKRRTSPLKGKTNG